MKAAHSRVSYSVVWECEQEFDGVTNSRKPTSTLGRNERASGEGQPSGETVQDGTLTGGGSLTFLSVLSDPLLLDDDEAEEEAEAGKEEEEVVVEKAAAEPRITGGVLTRD